MKLPNFTRTLHGVGEQNHSTQKIFGLLSSKNFATMATWRNDFSLLEPQLDQWQMLLQIYCQTRSVAIFLSSFHLTYSCMTFLDMSCKLLLFSSALGITFTASLFFFSLEGRNKVYSEMQYIIFWKKKKQTNKQTKKQIKQYVDCLKERY